MVSVSVSDHLMCSVLVLTVILLEQKMISLCTICAVWQACVLFVEYIHVLDIAKYDKGQFQKWMVGYSILKIQQGIRTYFWFNNKRFMFYIATTSVYRVIWQCYFDDQYCYIKKIIKSFLNDDVDWISSKYSRKYSHK